MHRRPGITDLPVASGDPLWPLHFVDVRFEPHDPLFDGEVELPKRHRPRRKKARAVVTALAALAVLESSACGGKVDESAPGLHATDAVLVQLQPGAPPPAPSPDEGGPPIVALDAIGPSGEAPLLRVPVQAGEDAVEVARRLSLEPGVAYAEPIYLYKTARAPSDPRFKDLWGLSRISAPQAWRQQTGDRKVVVAVIDDGVAVSHPDLAANVSTGGWNFLEENADVGGPQAERWHGTHVAGIIGAVGDNHLGISGVSWNVSLLPLRAFDADAGRSDAIARAIDYASARGARVIAAAWGGAGRSLAVERAIARAGTLGTLVIASAGNGSGPTPEFPASLQLDNVISVGASGPDDVLAGFSNRGALLAAPGVGILSTTSPGHYERYDGTSMAAAHVAGVAALLWSAKPHASVARVRQALLASGVAIDGAQSGRIDAAAALSALDAGDAQGALVLSSAALAFSIAPGRVPRAQELELRAEGGGATAWTAWADAPWLVLSASRGETPARLQVRVDPARLGAGAALAHVRVNDAEVEVTARPGRQSVRGTGCELRGDRLRVRARSACSLFAGAAPGVQWRLPGGSLREGPALHAQFVRPGQYELGVSTDEGAFDRIQVSVE